MLYGVLRFCNVYLLSLCPYTLYTVLRFCNVYLSSLCLISVLLLPPFLSHSDGEYDQGTERVWLPDLQLTFRDRDVLQNDATWLGDVLVNASQKLLKQQHPHVGGFQNTLLGQNFSFAPENTEFVQVLHGANHWLCLSTAGCKEGEVNVLDSLFNTVPPKVKRQIAVLMRSPSRKLKMNFLSVAQQKGASDCGLYAIANAAAVCAGLDATTFKYKQKSMRQHLLQCLEAGFITPFPHQKVEKKKFILSTQEFDVYCHCREPERGRMIKCGKCSEWFHSKCIPSVQCAQWCRRKSWFCSTCV